MIFPSNEKRAFLLYYSLPLLFGRIEEGSLLHLAFLVGGLYRLLKDSISETDLQEAGVFLKLYCAQAPLLYGERFQTFNIHQVLHLKQTVENLGPLWSNSCFPFEDFNGDLAGYFHGSQNIQGQIVKSVCVHQSLPRLAESLPEGSDAKELYKSLLSKSYVCRTIGEQIAEGTFVIGSLERVWDNSSLLTVKEREAVGAVSKIWIFRRAKLYGAEFQSSFYKRSTARNNFTIVYERNGKLHYGSIEKFAKYQAKCTTMSCQYKECSCELSFHYVALIKKMRKHPCQLPLYEGIKVINHITRVTVADNPIAIPMSSVKRKCMRIELDAAHVYVCHLPNSFEKD